MSEKMLTVTLVRHGETASNVDKILQGSLNTPLNTTGHLQAKEVASALIETPFVRAFCSSLQRCVETAEPVVSGRAMRTSYHKEIWEKDLGRLEGLPYLEATKQMRAEGKVLDDYGEGQAAFARRLLAFWDSTILPFAQGSPASEGILIVTHGGCIATLARELAARGYSNAPGYNGEYTVPRSNTVSTTWPTCTDQFRL